MRDLSRLDENASQTLYFISETNDRIKLDFRYLPTQESWEVDVEYKNFKVTNVRLFYYPNILSKWSNIIDFGLSVWTDNGYDPAFIDDFVTGRCIVSVLNQEEVRETEDLLNGKNKQNI